MSCFSKVPLGDIILPERMNCPYYYQPHPLCRIAADMVQDDIAARTEWHDEVQNGKMFGVLVVKDADGQTGYLKAYSGQIGGREDWDNWVPAVFDYLQPDGYFVTKEKEISDINREIAALQSSERYRIACARLAKHQADADKRIADYRLFMAEAKQKRNQRRADGEDEGALIRESQFQKAELKRLRQNLTQSLAPLKAEVEGYEKRCLELGKQRKRMSDDLQHWLFSQFVMVNGVGERRTLVDIFKPTAQGVPPSGAGECCAPKLLQYAFLHGMKPLAMAEFWWGRSPVGELRTHLNFYPACQGKCRPILDFMLQGVDVEPNPLELPVGDQTLDVVYDDEWFVVVNKPAGMLSVPGKKSGLSAQEILQRQYQSGMQESGMGALLPVHRLDMQTSGLLMFAKSEAAQREMQRMFATRMVKKQYYAVLDGEPICPREGVIELPLVPDYINRPRQMVDRENGKPSVTLYNIICSRDGRTCVNLYPQTGRTHQLRVHCAHGDGFGTPIVGDDLYGVHSERLLLHAQTLEFLHPYTHQPLHIESKPAF